MGTTFLAIKLPKGSGVHDRNPCGFSRYIFVSKFCRDISDTACLTFEHGDMSVPPQLAEVSTPDQQPISPKRPPRLRQILTMIAGAAIVFCAYWNLAVTYNATSQSAAREADDIVIQEQRFAPIRQHLTFVGYKGQIGIITDTDLVPGRPWNDRDGVVWGQTQYVMLPWMLMRGKRDTPFVIASFPDRVPDVPLEGYSKVLDVGDGFVLLRRNP
jgi:hypothetical protein